MSDHCPRAIHHPQVREKPTYVAGPYSAATEEGILRNVAMAIEVANALMRAGHLVFCPHLSHYQERHPTGNLGWQWWIDYDLEWVRRSAQIVRIPGESNGASIEVDTALAIGKRVYFWDDAEDWQELMTMYAPVPDNGSPVACDNGSPLAQWSGSLT